MNSIDAMQFVLTARPLLRNFGFEANPTLVNSPKYASLKSTINIMAIVLSISLLSEILYTIHTKVIHANGVSLVPTQNERHKYLSLAIGFSSSGQAEGKMF